MKRVLLLSLTLVAVIFTSYNQPAKNKDYELVSGRLPEVITDQPGMVLNPDETFKSTTIYRFSVK